MASELELNDFLKSVEKRAFKRMLYQVRDTEAALDIVQDSMMKLCSSYSDKPLTELPMLFQRILSNTMLDWAPSNCRPCPNGMRWPPAISNTKN